MIAYYLTHPQVEIEPDRPVPLWRLSALGRERLRAILDRPWLDGIERIVSSAETKAVEAAAMIAACRRVALEVADELGENDRSSTGFLAPDEFELAADRFFGEPEKSWNGWERAVDAAARIEAATERCLRASNKTTLFVGHGAVGTLLKCRIAGYPIARTQDQPPGGGNIYAFGIASRRLLCDWTPMEKFEGVRHAE
jgi:broad specificity phosphatase PhoE